MGAQPQVGALFSRVTGLLAPPTTAVNLLKQKNDSPYQAGDPPRGYGVEGLRVGEGLFHGKETSGILIPVWRRMAGAGLGRREGRKGERVPGDEMRDPG